MSALTESQREALEAMALVSVRRLRAGEAPNVSTADLSAETGRVGQVLGLVCGNLADAGLLQRRAPATYRLTAAGIAALRAPLQPEQERGARELLAERDTHWRDQVAVGEAIIRGPNPELVTWTDYDKHRRRKADAEHAIQCNYGLTVEELRGALARIAAKAAPRARRSAPGWLPAH